MFINIAMSEPWWVRFFGRFHWWFSRGFESDCTRRFHADDDRISIYLNTPLMPPEVLELGQLIADHLAGKYYHHSRISGDIVDAGGGSRSHAFGPTG